jgi:hypothetical protein
MRVKRFVSGTDMSSVVDGGCTFWFYPFVVCFYSDEWDFKCPSLEVNEFTEICVYACVCIWPDSRGLFGCRPILIG